MARTWTFGVIAGAVLVTSAAVTGAQGLPQSPFGGLRREAATGLYKTADVMRELVASTQSMTASVRVNDVTTGGQHLPTVTVGPAGQVYVAWVDCLSDQDCSTTNPDIYFAKSTDGGQHFSARVLVSDDGSNAFANAPKIATEEDDTIYVVWHDNRAATLSDDSWDVYLARSTDGGNTFLPSVRVNQHIANAYQYEPDVAVTPDGTIYVSWQRYAYDSNLYQWDSDVYVAKSTDDGVTFGANIKVSDGVSNQFKSTIGVGPSGNVYVAWSDFRDDAYGDVYFARSTDGGATFSSNILVNNYTTEAQVYPELAIDGKEKVYVVWLDGRRYGESANDISMARSTDLGLTFGSEIRVSDANLPSDSVATYLYPINTAAGNGFVAVAWYDDRTGDWETYLARSYDAGLTVTPSWRVNDLTTNSQSVPDVFMTSNHDVYCVYRDRNSGDFDIYFVVDTTTDANQTLAVARSGTGVGTVTSEPSGLNCGSTCSAQFPSGTVVTLAASADVGSVFGGWTGEGCSGSGTCKVTMIQARSVTATFTAGCSLTLFNHTITTTETYLSCGTLTAGPTFRVEAPGNVTVRAATSVILANGSSFGPGATFKAGLDPSLALP